MITSPIGRLPTIAILYCGDLGTALARLLLQAGYRVVTTCEGRSDATRERAAASGAEILPGLDEVVRAADVVFSLVTPSAAASVARQYAERGRLRPGGSVFVDANSLGLENLKEVASMLGEYDVPLVDAAIHGGAHRLAEIGVMYVSGPQAEAIAAIGRDVLPVESLGNEVGAASQMKLLLAALSKGLNVLFLEVGVLAERAAMLPQFVDGCRRFYPGIMTAIDRMLPTYAQHAERRVGELRSVEQLAESLEAPHPMIHAAAEFLARAARDAWRSKAPRPASASVAEIVRSVAQTSHPEGLWSVLPQVSS